MSREKEKRLIKTQKFYQEMNFVLRRLSLCVYPVEQVEVYATLQITQVSQQHINISQQLLQEDTNPLIIVLLPMRNQTRLIITLQVAKLENQTHSPTRWVKSLEMSLSV